MSESRKYLKIEPSGFMELKDLDESKDLLDTIHSELNGGFFDLVRCRALPHKFLMLVDDCGLLKNLQLNPIAQLLYGQPIAGTAIIMREDFYDGEPDIFGLTSEDVEELMHKLRGLIVITEVNE